MHNWEVADLIALNALAVTSVDIGKMAKVATPSGFYFLVSDVGPVWTKVDKPATYVSFLRTDVLAAGVGEARWYPPAATTITSIQAWVSTAPIGANLIATVKKNGTIIHTVTITAGTTAFALVAVSYSLLATDYLTVDLTQVGSTVAGKNLAIRLGFL